MSMTERIAEGREVAQILSSTSRLMGEHDFDMDQDARDLAHAAMAKIDGHEDVCSERWRQSRDATARLETAITVLQTKLQKAMDERIAKLPATIIAALTGIIGFLAARVWPAH